MIKRIEKLLHSVEKPARYTGGEMNMVKKTGDFPVRYAFLFPDAYEVGMSNLGFQIIYDLFNQRQDTYCERAFAPWVDMEAQMRQAGIPLFSLETFRPIAEFDIIGFTLQYEMNYTNIVNMLDLAGLPALAKDRTADMPLVMAGGLCAYNPEPLADIIDFFYIGEGEVCLNEMIDLYAANKQSGGTKDTFLEKLTAFPNMYIPKFYDVAYHEDGTIASFVPNHPKAPRVIQKAYVQDIERLPGPANQIVPLIEVVHDRISAELFRGCIRGCRFCQAGYINRPQREKKPATVKENVTALASRTGHEEASLVSLSTSDYSHLPELLDRLTDGCCGPSMRYSLPSMRVDAFSLALFQKLEGQRKISLTFAPEAGSQRMRDIINKNLSEREILSGIRQAFEGGYYKIKLYFMAGLPGETDEDLLGIADLCAKILSVYGSLPADQKGRLSISASCSCFVPKPHTPFQWAEQVLPEHYIEKQKMVKGAMPKRVRYTYHEARLSALEGALSRGDRRIGQVIIRAAQLGCRFDGWSEHFNPDQWDQAFADCGLDPAFYSQRTRALTELLPWDHIDCGVSKDFLIRELERAKQAITSPNCREGCMQCGLSCLQDGGGAVADSC